MNIKEIFIKSVIDKLNNISSHHFSIEVEYYDNTVFECTLFVDNHYNGFVCISDLDICVNTTKDSDDDELVVVTSLENEDCVEITTNYININLG